MLNYARRSYDLYTNSLGGYTEAKRSLKMNRKAFKENLQHLLTKKKEPDAFFFLSLEQLLKSELKLNAALHGLLKAKAHLERFLFQDKDKISRYFPEKGKILKVFSKTKNKNLLAQKKLDKLDTFFIEVKHTSKLKEVLFHHHLIESFKDFSEQDIIDAVQRNMSNEKYEFHIQNLRKPCLG